MKQFQSFAEALPILRNSPSQAGSFGLYILDFMQTTDSTNTLTQKLADPATQKPELQMSGPIDAVGMSQIEVPIILKSQNGDLFKTPAKVDAFVSLDAKDSRGIHMSRLFTEVQSKLPAQVLSFNLLDQMLTSFLITHEGLSLKAQVSVNFEALLERKALKSQNTGFRTYPVKMSAEVTKGQSPKHFLEVLVTYSSTCPASAALSRQMIQENFKNEFRNQEIDFKNLYDWLGTTKGISATPHAQRSHAVVKVEVKGSLEAAALIDLIEDALQTPVQTAVKREDEQEFAFRNGQNLMFCEDAARRMQNVLANNPNIGDFRAEARHLESLHPHDAVSIIRRGTL